MEEKEIVEALVASLIEAINERLENAALVIATSGTLSGETAAKIVRDFKVDTTQINVMRK